MKAHIDTRNALENQMNSTYIATVKHESLTFTGKGATDHQAVTKAMDALKSCWSIHLSRAVLEVRLGGQLQYVTTFGKYETATR